MSGAFSALDQRCINTIRTLSIDAIQKANSGHPGLPLGAAPMAYVLWQRHLRHDPHDPDWTDRDRFVLSPGHGSMLLYSLLHLTGYDVTLDDIKAFRQWESKTPGHPEAILTPGVEATTGPLGQGTANAVGMAMAERALAHRFNRPDHTIVDHTTYALVSDGDLMEGLSAEAASLAGHLGLGKLIYLYDANDISLDGPTSLTFSTEDVATRYRSYGWHVLSVEDGDNDLDAIDEAISEAKAQTDRPSIIVIKTTIGFGSPNKAGSSSSHGSPLGPDEIALTKRALDCDPDAHFFIADDALDHFRQAVTHGGSASADWKGRFERYAAAHPEDAAAWTRTLTWALPDGWDTDLPTWDEGAKLATRVAGGTVLNTLAQRIPSLLTGSADVSGSTKTNFTGAEAFNGQTGAGRNVFYGVREHAMGSIANGMAYHGGVRPVVSTFFCFSDYMRPAVRIAALNDLPVLCVWTHDSVGLGEDGPTHQPVEHLSSLRAMPNLVMFRPGDPNEATEAWRWAMTHTDGPVGFVMSRQGLPVLDRSRATGSVAQGGYIFSEAASEEPVAVIIATGSELALAVAAQALLEADGVATRVVSMPSTDLFERQSAEYQASVLPPKITARVSVEAGVTYGWERWVGLGGAMVGVDRYGTSAPGPLIMERYGFTSANVVEKVKACL